MSRPVFESRPLRRPPAWRLGLSTVKGRAYPRVVGQQREPSWLIFDILLPLLAVVALLLVYRTLGADRRFEGYVILGGAMTAFWLNTIWLMAMQFRWEKQSGNLEIYMVAPPHLTWILVGMALGGSVATTIRAATVMAVGALMFDVPFQWQNSWAAVVVLMTTISALYGVGMTAASLFLRFGRGVEKVMESLQEPVYLLTGSFFPVRALGLGLAVAGSVVPLTLGLDALRQLLLPGDALQLLAWPVETAILALYAVVAFAVSRWSLARMEQMAKREGTLSLRWD